MSLLDSVVGALGQGGNGGGGQGALLQAVIGMLNNGGQGGNGLGALVQQFEQGGLGHLISSWVGTGQNLPISAEQLQNVLGSDTIARLAQQLGQGHGEVASQLSQILPQVVDKLTPQGQIPQGGFGDLGGLLGGLLGRTN